MKIENFIAFRYLKESRKNKDISSSSIIVILVISAAIIFHISAVSIMNGYIIGIMKIAYEVKSFHIDYPAYYSYEDSKNILEFVKENKEVYYANLYRETKALLSANGKNTGIVYFRSVPKDIFEKDKGLNSSINILGGKKSLEKNEIMISQKTAQKLKLETGDTLYLTAMLSMDSPEVTLKRFKVSGIFTTGYVELDEQIAYISNTTAKKVFDKKIGFSIFIKLKDPKKATLIAGEYKSSGFGGMLSWEETNYNELTALKFERNIISFIVILVIFVAALNILSTIYITVFEKTRDIGILKANGISPRKMISIFLLNGIYLGFIGTVSGITLGLLIMKWLNELMQYFAEVINVFNKIIYNLSSLFIKSEEPQLIEIFSKDFYLDKIYTEISFAEIMIIASLTLLFSTIASIIPALRAGKIKPIEVIKNG